MSQIFYEKRCRCKEEFLITKKRKFATRSEGKPHKYPDFDEEIPSKIFHIQYEKKLSLEAKFILNSFKNKYLYYAIDDILYLFHSNTIEQENLLAILYSPVLSLHNNMSINFFDIWIQEIYIHEVPQVNRFLKQNGEVLKTLHYITLKLIYKPKRTLKKKTMLW